MTEEMSPWPRRAPDPPPSDDEGGSIHDRGMESARRTSSLPSGVFRARSPNVEQALADGVAEVFLRHMSRIEGTADVPQDRPADQRHEGEEKITEADRLALLAALREHHDAPPPPLHEGLGGERTWVLLDLTVHGDPRARAAAVSELIGLAESDPPFEGHSLDMLRELVTELDRIASDERPSLVIDGLRRAARAALARSHGDAK